MCSHTTRPHLAVIPPLVPPWGQRGGRLLLLSDRHPRGVRGVRACWRRGGDGRPRTFYRPPAGSCPAYLFSKAQISQDHTSYTVKVSIHTPDHVITNILFPAQIGIEGLFRRPNISKNGARDVIILKTSLRKVDSTPIGTNPPSKWTSRCL